MTNDKTIEWTIDAKDMDSAIAARARVEALLQGPKTHPGLDEWNTVETPHRRECLNAALKARAMVKALLS